MTGAWDAPKRLGNQAGCWSFGRVLKAGTRGRLRAITPELLVGRQ